MRNKQSLLSQQLYLSAGLQMTNVRRAFNSRRAPYVKPAESYTFMKP